MGKQKRVTKQILEQREAERIQREQRNAQIMDALLRGESKRDIALKFGISPTTVRDVIQSTREDWKEARIEDFDFNLTVELARIDRIEREAWAAYEGSKKPIVTQTRRSDGQRNDKGDLNITSHEVKTQERHPDPRYMNIIQWCVEQRLKIMGGYAPEKHAATTPDGKSPAPFTKVAFVQINQPVNRELDIDVVTVQALPSST